MRTAQAGIFSADSIIRYCVDDKEVIFYFDEHLGSLNCKTGIDQRTRELFSVELPIPYGNRFNYFQSISRADRHIRRQIILEEYSRPQELIEFLSAIYSSKKFHALIETEIDGRSYFSILCDNGRYIREDYFSSGEYFLIDLYRMFKGSARLIVVDEIDLSLDAAAQVQLLKKLREFCAKYECLVYDSFSGDDAYTRASRALPHGAARCRNYCKARVLQFFEIVTIWIYWMGSIHSYRGSCA